MKIKSGLCKNCEKKTKVEKAPINHILHIILVICTGGFWFPVWAYACLFKSNWRCSTCGNKVVEVY